MVAFLLRASNCVLVASLFVLGCSTLPAPAPAPTPGTPAEAMYYLEALDRPGDDLSTMAIAHALVDNAREDVRQLGRQYADAVFARASTSAWTAAHAIALDPDARARARWRSILERAAYDNGYFALLLMGQDDVRDDTAAVASWIGIAAKAPTFRSVYAQEIGPVADRLVANDSAEDDSARAAAIEAAMTVVTSATPPLGPFWNACKAATGSNRRDCRALAARMAESDALIHALFGSRLLELTADDKTARDAARERWREVVWLLHSAPRILSGSDWSIADHAYAAALREQGEVAAIEAFLVAQDGTARPPDDWQPADPPPVK